MENRNMGSLPLESTDGRNVKFLYNEVTDTILVKTKKYLLKGWKIQTIASLYNVDIRDLNEKMKEKYKREFNDLLDKSEEYRKYAIDFHVGKIQQGLLM